MMLHILGITTVLILRDFDLDAALEGPDSEFKSSQSLSLGYSDSPLAAAERVLEIYGML
jgi:hypothetical protein